MKFWVIKINKYKYNFFCKIHKFKFSPMAAKKQKFVAKNLSHSEGSSLAPLRPKTKENLLFLRRPQPLQAERKGRAAGPSLVEQYWDRGHLLCRGVKDITSWQLTLEGKLVDQKGWPLNPGLSRACSSAIVNSHTAQLDLQIHSELSPSPSAFLGKKRRQSIMWRLIRGLSQI